jgi:hypothetical protein
MLGINTILKIPTLASSTEFCYMPGLKAHFLHCSAARYQPKTIIVKVTCLFYRIGKGKKGKVVPLGSIEALLGERSYSSYSFLTSALEGGEWSASSFGRALTPRKELGPRAGLDAEVRGKILCLSRGWNPGHPVHSQTLYRLSYPGSGGRLIAIKTFLGRNPQLAIRMILGRGLYRSTSSFFGRGSYKVPRLVSGRDRNIAIRKASGVGSNIHISVM